MGRKNRAKRREMWKERVERNGKEVNRRGRKRKEGKIRRRNAEEREGKEEISDKSLGR